MKTQKVTLIIWPHARAETLLDVPLSRQNRQEQKGHLDSGSDAEIGVDAQPRCAPCRGQWAVLTVMVDSYSAVSIIMNLYSYIQRIYILTYILQRRGPELGLHSAVQYQGNV